MGQKPSDANYTSNMYWLKKKYKYEKTHKYAGDPFLLIDHANSPSIKENSAEAIKTRN